MEHTGVFQGKMDGEVVSKNRACHPLTKRKVRTMNKPTYEDGLIRIIGPIERFDQKNTIFSKARWDEAFMGRIRAVVPVEVSKDLELEGEALTRGGIFVDDKAGTLHPRYNGYSGHLMGIGGLYDWREPISEEKLSVDDPEKMSEKIKDVPRFYGADSVGICKVDQRWVYSHYYDHQTRRYGVLNLPYKYAIVIGIEMNWRMIKKSPGYEAAAATALGYSRMAEVSSSLAKYIRSLGYPAVPSGNDIGQSIPFAIDAGPGELGRLGLLITPEFGPRLRLCKVFTDLPLKQDKPIEFGVVEFCQSKCPKNCAYACPAQAIPLGDPCPEPISTSNRKNISRWIVNAEKCYLFWKKNRTDCSNCVAVCPFNTRPR